MISLLFSRLPPKSKLRNRATRKMETSNFSGVTDHKEEKDGPPMKTYVSEEVVQEIPAFQGGRKHVVAIVIHQLPWTTIIANW